MAEVLRVVLSRVELRAVRPVPDPVVLRGITLAPLHGAPVRGVSKRAATPEASREPAAATAGA